MKITKSQLKQIIKEELKGAQLLKEWGGGYVAQVSSFAQEVFDSNPQAFLSEDSPIRKELGTFVRGYRTFSDNEYHYEPQEKEEYQKQIDAYRKDRLVPLLKKVLEEAGNQDLWKIYTDAFITGEGGDGAYIKMVNYFFEQLSKSIDSAEESELSKRSAYEVYDEIEEEIYEFINYDLDLNNHEGLENKINTFNDVLMQNIKIALLTPDTPLEQRIENLHDYSSLIEGRISDFESGNVPESYKEQGITDEHYDIIIDYSYFELRRIDQLIEEIEDEQVAFDGGLSEMIKQELAKLLKEHSK
jgi:hypothetical protein